MYSTIMDLPLFKGISKDHVSAFLEKTHVSFVNYGKGERLHDRCQPCRVMRFVISGSVRVSHTHISETCTISPKFDKIIWKNNSTNCCTVRFLFVPL